MPKRKQSEETQRRMAIKDTMSKSKPLLANVLSECKGKVLPREMHPMSGICPLHGCSGTQTAWLPPSGLNPDMREFCCQLGHAFYLLRGGAKE